MRCGGPVTYLWGDPDREPGRDGFPLPVSAYGRPPRHRRAGRIALIVVAVVVVAAIAGVGVVKVLPGMQGNDNTAGFHPAGHSPSADAEQIAAAFLRAWSAGQLGEAAGLTDDPAGARRALAGYRQGLNLRKLTGAVTGTAAAMAPAVPAGMPTAGAAASSTLERVAFRINATVAGSASPAAVSGTWSYRSALTAYQVPHGSGWFIQWLPGVVAPGLTDGQQLAAVAVPPQGTSVTDSAGHPLSSYNDPGLATVANLLTSAAPNEKGSPGLAVQIQDASDGAVSGGQTTIIAPEGGRVATTISPRAEQAASTAVSGADGSAMLVIQPSTGHILAIANNAGSDDYALLASVAPGSTMKIITATALINSGLVSETSPVGCPLAYTVTGITFHNDKGESEPAGTPFMTDFAQSCNNAFTQQWPHLSGALASTAKEYFGLNQKWNLGITGVNASYFSAPASASGSELAQEAFGQGDLTASPIAMASVAATVGHGIFQQPFLVPGTKQVTATPLPQATDTYLKEMMREVVTSGTATGLNNIPGGPVMAKTGTAEYDNNPAHTHIWTIGWQGDIAFAVFVQNGGVSSGAVAIAANFLRTLAS